MNSTTSGLLLIDKPTGMTSFDVIRRLRRQTGIRKMGHAGTLDPAASGLMLLLIGSTTKRASALTKLDKRYAAELTLGYTSTTQDREGDLNRVSDRQPSVAEVERVLSDFKGEVSQVPSQYSAIKINGVRAYVLARAGKEVIMPARQVTIHENTLVNYAYPRVVLEAHVSSGTYIRSLGADIGERLGTGAYVSKLRRTAVGTYRIAQAAALENITEASLAQHLIII